MINTIVVTGGSSIEAFSGSAYYLSEGLKKCAPEISVKSTKMKRYKNFIAPTLKWIFLNRLDPRYYFFLTREYQEANFRSENLELNQHDVYLSFSPIIPRRAVHMPNVGRVALYIDMTISFYIENYHQFVNITNKLKKSLLEEEHQSYSSCDQIFVFSNDVKNDLIGRYGIPNQKIEVIGRGVNLSNATLSQERKYAPHSNMGKLRIGFVGVDFERKGLLRVVSAIDRLSLQVQNKLELVVVGPKHEKIPFRPFIRSLGYLDKGTDYTQMIDVMRTCDFGCLLSDSEGIPGSVIEFLMLGVPCIVSDIPGMSSLKEISGVMSMPLDTSSEQLAEVILKCIESEKYLDNLKDLAIRSDMSEYEWDRPARKILDWVNHNAIN